MEMKSHGSSSSSSNGAALCEAELKHSRIAMLAALDFLVNKKFQWNPLNLLPSDPTAVWQPAVFVVDAKPPATSLLDQSHHTFCITRDVNVSDEHCGRLTALVPRAPHTLSDSDLQHLTTIVNQAYTTAEAGMWKEAEVKRTNPDDLASKIKEEKLIVLFFDDAASTAPAASAAQGTTVQGICGTNDSIGEIVGCVYLDRDYKGEAGLTAAELCDSMADSCDSMAEYCDITTRSGSTSIEIPKLAQFGMLVVSEAHRGKRFGNFLIEACEQYAKADGCAAIRCEVLSPRDWVHPLKVRLHEYYQRLGYRRQDGDFFEAFFLRQYNFLAEDLKCECKLEIYAKSLER